jgi:hypothetical protein
MLIHGMSETLCCGLHWGAIKRRSHTGWYMTIGGGENVRLWSRYAVMLCRGKMLGNTGGTRCVAIRCRERGLLGHRLSSVLTGDAGGLRVAFWGCLAIDRGGFANSRFHEREGVAMWWGNLLPITVRVYPLLNLVIP